MFDGGARRDHRIELDGKPSGVLAALDPSTPDDSSGEVGDLQVPEKRALLHRKRAVLHPVPPQSQAQVAPGVLARLGRRLGGFERIAAITATLTGTQAATSALGFVYWAFAARHYPIAAVGLAGAAIAAMQLLGNVGMLGLGTLLIDRLPHIPQHHRRLVVRTSLAIVALASTVLGVVFALGVRFIPLRNLSAIASPTVDIVIFAAGVTVTGIALVLDQAVLALGTGALQLERNVVASGLKIAALVVLSSVAPRDGMVIYLSWMIGSIISMLWVVVRTRGGWRYQASRRLVDLQSVRGLGRAAASHHALNLALQTPLMLLPPIVALVVSTVANGYFSTVILVASFVFAVPFAIAIGLFASTAGDERQLLTRIRLTIPLGIACSLAAVAVLYPFAHLVLSAFGSSYASHGVTMLRILVLAGVPLVLKDHYIAMRRVQRRTGRAAWVVALTGVVELVASLIGAHFYGVVGLCVAWVGVLALESVGFALALIRAYRAQFEPEMST